MYFTAYDKLIKEYGVKVHGISELLVAPHRKRSDVFSKIIYSDSYKSNKNKKSLYLLELIMRRFHNTAPCLLYY